MLKWENYVIQHEKMRKLREDISDSFKSNTLKLEIIERVQAEIKSSVEYFHMIGMILDETQAAMHYIRSNSDSFTGNSAYSNNNLSYSFEEEDLNLQTDELLDLKERVQSM